MNNFFDSVNYFLTFLMYNQKNNPISMLDKKIFKRDYDISLKVYRAIFDDYSEDTTLFSLKGAMYSKGNAPWYLQEP